MLPRHHPDRIRIAFDDRRLVANAGLLLPATFSQALVVGGEGQSRPGPAASHSTPSLMAPLCH